MEIAAARGRDAQSAKSLRQLAAVWKGSAAGFDSLLRYKLFQMLSHAFNRFFMAAKRVSVHAVGVSFRFITFLIVNHF